MTFDYIINNPYGDKLIKFNSPFPIPYIKGDNLYPNGTEYEEDGNNPCVITDIVHHVDIKEKTHTTIIWLDENYD